jgi:hypothetical protein
MNSERRTAIIVGVLFIIATVSSIIGTFVFLEPITGDPDYLIKAYENKTQLILGVLIDALNSIAVIVIAAVLYPILKKISEAFAIGYVASRIIESVILIIGHISLFSLLSLSQEFVQTGAQNAAHLLPLGRLLLAVNDWTFLFGPGIAFGITALVLNYLFYQSKLVPRFLSVWGFIGGTLLLAADVLAIFGLGTASMTFALLILPIGLNEMALAAWLIIKGFNPTAIKYKDIKEL